jgi:cytochrome c biogenesis protein
MRARPPAPPRNLSRLPVSTSFTVAAPPGEVVAAAHRLLRRARWRTDRRTADGVESVAAEKGYLRESGNLLFHVALLALLAAVAYGSLYSYRGQFSVIEGRGFTNAAPLYDIMPTGGQRLSADDLVPFTIALEDFRATYLDNGQPTDFHADVRWAPRVGQPERARDIRVNHPLAVGGAKVYLMGHGFAPRFVVKDKAGKVVYDDYRVFLPQDGTNEVGVGVLKVPNGVRPQVGMEAAIFPTLTIDRTEGFLYSSSPEPKRPGLSYRIYQGDLRLGVSAQDDFTLDKRGLLAVKEGTLLPGESVRLDNGTTVAFADLREYAVFQTTRDPGARPALIAAGSALAGLVASLFVRRRRVWVRATAADGGTVVSVGGLARHDPDSFGPEFDDLAADLRRALGAAADPQQQDPQINRPQHRTEE